MRVDIWTKVALWSAVALLFLNFAPRFFVLKSALAEPQVEKMPVGRYQISAWAAHSGGNSTRFGYYVLDTVTGKLVNKETDVRVGSGSK